MGSTNATFVDLIKKANHDYLPKLKGEDNDRLTRILTEAVAALGADEPFPQSLNADQQGRFQLSMYKQRAEFHPAA